MTEQDEAVSVTVANILQDLGYRSEEVREGVIKSSFSGTKVMVQSYDGETVQFVALWSELPASFDFETANKFNSSYRFGSVFLNESSLALQANFLFNPREKDSASKLQMAVSIFEGLIGELIDLMSEQTADDETEHEV